MELNDVVVEKNREIPMRDGVVLAADVFRPAHGEPAPTLVTRTVYGKENVHYISSGNYPLPVRLAEQGYAVVVNDTRGRFSSGGDFVPYVHEATDGYDTVEWAAAQPWSNGDTAVFGCSYLGLTTLLAAREAPPSLRCAIAMVAPSNAFVEMSNGSRLGWLVAQAITNLHRPDHGVPPESQQALFAAIAGGTLQQPARPVASAPGLSAPGVAPYFEEMLSHDRLDDYWLRAAPDADYSRYTVPILHMGGWWDNFNIGTIRNFTGISSATDHPQHLFMGPWGHQEYDQIYGEYDLGSSAMIGVPRRGGGGIMATYLDFFARHLHDAEVEIPRVKYFVVGPNEWHTDETWPPADATAQCLYLSSGGAANTADGDGVLLSEPSGGQTTDLFRYDPTDPVSMDGAPRAQMRLPGPQDHSWLEHRPDILCYSTPPLTAPLSVVGPVRLRLWAATDGPDTDWTAKLLDVFPDGRAAMLRTGHLSARFRNGYTNPRTVVPDEPTCYEMDLGSTAIVLPVGHRLRLHVSSSSWPDHYPNPNTGEPIATSAATRVATQRVFHDAEHPSAIEFFSL